MPNRVQAFLAALVQVTNTTANPVPNWGVDNPARNVFRLAGELPLQGTQVTTGSLSVPAIFPVAPALGRRDTAVIQALDDLVEAVGLKSA